MTIKKKIIRTIRIVLLVGMLTALCYPKVADAWNRYVADQQIGRYAAAVTQKADTEDLDREYDKAVAYNEALYASGSNHIYEYTERLTKNEKVDAQGFSYGTADDPDYEGTLDITGGGQIGVLDIRKINVRLPIYHYTSDVVLEKGIGHLYGSSLPVGGVNTRTVLTGHRGLPTMELFTNLDKMEIGDQFTIEVLGRTLTYEVEDIQTVLPEEVDELGIEAGEDLVSLVTCTPYGVNTHRLIVTGRRVETPVTKEPTVTQTVQEAVQAPVSIMVAAAVVYIAATIYMIWIWTRPTKKRTQAGK